MGGERALHPPLRISLTQTRGVFLATTEAQQNGMNGLLPPGLTGMNIEEALDVYRFYDKIVL